MFYDIGKIGDDMNYWKLGDQIRLYSGLGIGGALTLTSLLATVGSGSLWLATHALKCSKSMPIASGGVATDDLALLIAAFAADTAHLA